MNHIFNKINFKIFLNLTLDVVYFSRVFNKLCPGLQKDII